MRLSPGDRLKSYELLRICVIVALLAGFALSPKLWLSSRLYPLTPVWSFLRPLGSPGDRIVLFATIALLIGSLVRPGRVILAAACALLLVLAIQDQSRWQPWFYQYAIMLMAIALAGVSRQKSALNTCRLIVAATYLWSGLAKLNPEFLTNTFPWLMGPFIKIWPGPGQWAADHLAVVAACIECAAGVGLLTRRFRQAAVFAAIAMHAFILISLGPLGLNFNAVVWPWNLAMVAFLWILFSRRAEEPSLRDIVWGRAYAFQKIVLVLFGLMPILSFFHLWDDYLSCGLYSGNVDSGTIQFNDTTFDRLPRQIQGYVTADAPNRHELDFDTWSLDEMGVPAYPQIRIFRNVTRRICGYAKDDSSVKLVIEGKFALANGSRSSNFHCSDLKRSF
jgi:uncharacterized membrane protein YphA (DoxX/SURF4 family)